MSKLKENLQQPSFLFFFKNFDNCFRYSIGYFNNKRKKGKILSSVSLST